MTEHENIGIAEHGARRGILYARCACGWSGPPRRSLTRAAEDNLWHEAHAATVAELWRYKAEQEGDHHR